MALAKTIRKFGVTFQKAYCRVTNITGDKRSGFTYEVEAFANKSAASDPDNSLGGVGSGTIAYDPKAAGDILAQCYADLKKQDGWKNAADC